jgi:acetyltransferase-like isoleucine patch superfamily enzyme
LLILRKIIDRVLFHTIFKYIYQSKFKSYGENIRWGRDASFFLIPRNIRISYPNLISIGDNVRIDEGVFLQCHIDGGGIEIQRGSRINTHTHIQAHSKITIEEKVLIAPFSLLHSGKHGNDGQEAIMDQEYISSGEIIIGKGSWLGHGTKILGGSKLSSNTTVAAGAIVNKCFEKPGKTLVGIPAREI